MKSIIIPETTNQRPSTAYFFPHTKERKLHDHLDHSQSQASSFGSPKDASKKALMSSLSSLNDRRNRRTRSAANLKSAINDFEWWQNNYNFSREEILGLPVDYFKIGSFRPNSSMRKDLHPASPTMSPIFYKDQRAVLKGGITLTAVKPSDDHSVISQNNEAKKKPHTITFMSPQQRKNLHLNLTKKTGNSQEEKSEWKKKSEASESMANVGPHQVTNAAIVKLIHKKMFSKNKVIKKLNEYLKGRSLVSDTLSDYKEKLIEYHYQEIRNQLSTQLSKLDFDSLFNKENKMNTADKKEMVAAFLLGFSHNTRYKKFCKQFKKHLDKKDHSTSGKIGIVKGLVSVSDFWDENFYRDILAHGEYHRIKDQMRKEFKETSNG